MLSSAMAQNRITGGPEARPVSTGHLTTQFAPAPPMPFGHMIPETINGSIEQLRASDEALSRYLTAPRPTRHTILDHVSPTSGVLPFSVLGRIIRDSTEIHSTKPSVARYSEFRSKFTLPLPPPVEGGGSETLSPGGRGEGEGAVT